MKNLLADLQHFPNGKVILFFFVVGTLLLMSTLIDTAVWFGRFREAVGH